MRLVDAIPKQPSWFERYYVDVYMVILAIICFVTVVVHNVLRLLLYISVQFLHYARRNGRKPKNSYQGAVDPGSDPGAVQQWIRQWMKLPTMMDQISLCLLYLFICVK